MKNLCEGLDTSDIAILRAVLGEAIEELNHKLRLQTMYIKNVSDINCVIAEFDGEEWEENESEEYYRKLYTNTRKRLNYKADGIHCLAQQFWSDQYNGKHQLENTETALIFYPRFKVEDGVATHYFTGKGDHTDRIYIPDDVFTIETTTFSAINPKYDRVTYIKFGKNVRTVESYAFNPFTKLVTIELNDSLYEIQRGGFSLVPITHIGINTAKENVLPSSIRYIGDHAFSETSIDNLVIVGRSDEATPTHLDHKVFDCDKMTVTLLGKIIFEPESIVSDGTNPRIRCGKNDTDTIQYLQSRGIQYTTIRGR